MAALHHLVLSRKWFNHSTVSTARKIPKMENKMKIQVVNSGKVNHHRGVVKPGNVGEWKVTHQPRSNKTGVSQEEKRLPGYAVGGFNWVSGE